VGYAPLEFIDIVHPGKAVSNFKQARSSTIGTCAPFQAANSISIQRQRDGRKRF
jgi:hypothetical protein